MRLPMTQERTQGGVSTGCMHSTVRGLSGLWSLATLLMRLASHIAFRTHPDERA